MVRGIDAVLHSLGAGWGEIALLVHGTTIATDALLTRRGGTVALFSTEGLRDAVALRRGRRSHIYDNRRAVPAPLVPRTRRYGVTERTLANGEVAIDLEPQALLPVLDDAAQRGAEAIAVCFLHSYANPDNEERAREIIDDYAGEHGLDWHVSISSRLTREIGYFERTSTTVLDAYLGPTVVSYLDALQAAIAERGFAGVCTIKQISSGTCSIAQARRAPIHVLNSGPTGAAGAGVAVAASLGHRDGITFDMGGTSCDVCLLVDGAPLTSVQSSVDGHHLQLTAIDIVTIGAGGGSIVATDASGLPRVGPRSAGADPGPACYGRGGTMPTVTDADLVLGLIDAERFHGSNQGSTAPPPMTRSSRWRES